MPSRHLSFRTAKILTLYRPIQTYRNQGTRKHGVLAEDHAIIYTGVDRYDEPDPLAGEELTKNAIRVEAAGNESLHPCSRVNFGKTYTVEHNVKVLEVGKVTPEHIVLLDHYWRIAMQGDP